MICFDLENPLGCAETIDCPFLVYTDFENLLLGLTPHQLPADRSLQFAAYTFVLHRAVGPCQVIMLREENFHDAVSQVCISNKQVMFWNS